MAASPTLRSLRERIDNLDEQIQHLLSERAHCAQQVAELKQQPGAKARYYRPEREAQILRRVRERNTGPLRDRTMVRLFREIISACLALEQSLTVAYLCPPGTFTHHAALHHFGRAVRTTAVASIDDAFREVEAETADFAVVPVDNSTEAVVGQTLERFAQSPLCICGETVVPVHQQLISRAAGLKEIERLYARRQALLQCREWLDGNLPQVERIVVASNSEAAQRAAKDSSSAAITSPIAAEVYELSILASNIEDNPDMATRYLIIGHEPVAASGQDRTTVLIAAADHTGLLHRILEPLARHQIAVSRIESRPSRQPPWDQLFFVDIEGHQDQPTVSQALAELAELADFYKCLGSYPIDIN